MTRWDFQTLSAMRLKEAKALFGLGHYPGAYYLAGYALECALKACIAKRTQKYDFPDKEKTRDAYTHEMSGLLKAAGLDEALKLQAKVDLVFGENWLLILRWSEQTRYHRDITAEQARALLSAISDGNQGVLTWLKRCW